MTFIKTLHVLFAFIWIGNLLALTRLMGYQVKEDEPTQMRLARIYRRIYTFVGLPAMMLVVILGAFLYHKLDQENGIQWFMFKLVFALGLILCDAVSYQFIADLNRKPAAGRGVKYKVLHGIAGLFLIAVMVCIYVLR